VGQASGLPLAARGFRIGSKEHAVHGARFDRVPRRFRTKRV
jgi:hypothetical protein